VVPLYVNKAQDIHETEGEGEGEGDRLFTDTLHPQTRGYEEIVSFGHRRILVHCKYLCEVTIFIKSAWVESLYKYASNVY
jgi:hypothetical protein